MLFLLACVTEPEPVEETLAGCTADVQQESNSRDCVQEFDQWANLAHETCLDEDGTASDISQTFDEAGCPLEARWYFEWAEGGDWEWTATFTCDEHGRVSEGEDHQVEHDPDGTLSVDERDSWIVETVYEGDRWVSAVTTDEDGDITTEAWTWNAAGLVATATRVTSTSSSETTYTYDRRGNLTELRTDSGRSTRTRTYTWDARDRRVDAAYYDGDDLDQSSHLDYDGATPRYLTDDVDTDGDGAVDATDTYFWTCPG